jgi:hypothetical protein
MSKGNIGNLIYGDKLSQERARELGRMGGALSAPAKKKKKLFKEAIEVMLNKPLPEHLKDELLKYYTKEEVKELTVAQAMAMRLIEKVITMGDVPAFKELADRVGGKALQELTGIDGESLAPPVINVIAVDKK